MIGIRNREYWCMSEWRPATDRGSQSGKGPREIKTLTSWFC